MGYECTNTDGSPFVNSWFSLRKVFVDSQQADTSKEESAIDELVYQLYGLTEDEIRIVEGKNDG
jgi:hypothetical protein